jgi:hypothetical protein
MSTRPSSAALRLVFILLTHGALTFAETYTLLSENDYEGASRWSLQGMDNQGQTWTETGWASRLSSSSDPNGTGTLSSRVYVDIADAGSKLWALRNAASTWIVDGFDRLGRADGTSVTLQGVTPATRIYLGFAADEVTGNWFLLRNSGGWVADRFTPSGALSASAAVSFGNQAVVFRGWAKTSSGKFIALRAPEGATSYRIQTFSASGDPENSPSDLLDLSGHSFPGTRLLRGLSASAVQRPKPGDVMGPFLNGAFGGFARSAGAGGMEVVRAYPNLLFTEPSAMLADPTGPRFLISERPGLISWITTN